MEAMQLDTLVWPSRPAAVGLHSSESGVAVCSPGPHRRRALPSTPPVHTLHIHTSATQSVGTRRASQMMRNKNLSIVEPTEVHVKEKGGAGRVCRPYRCVRAD